MNKIKRKNNYLSAENRKKIIDKIIGFFADERGEEIGYIAAEEVLEFFVSEIGKEIYQKGVKDSQKLMEKWYTNLEIDLEVLSKEED